MKQLRPRQVHGHTAEDNLNTPAGKFDRGTKIKGRARFVVRCSRAMVARPSVCAPPSLCANCLNALIARLLDLMLSVGARDEWYDPPS